MARIFITGSADGLGKLAAQRLIRQGHDVVLHVRNADRAEQVRREVPGAAKILIADLSSLDQSKGLAHQINTLGRFDAVIHNAGVYQVPGNVITAVNTIAPYVLTCLILRPQRLIYLSSGLHLGGKLNLENLAGHPNRINYSDSKLHVVTLAMALARKWPDVFSNAVNPGWVPTKMGGQGAPDNLEKGAETQEWLATSDDPQATVSGHYFHHKKISKHNALADDVNTQEKFLSVCEEISGVKFPAYPLPL